MGSVAKTNTKRMVYISPRRAPKSEPHISVSEAHLHFWWRKTEPSINYIQE